VVSISVQVSLFGDTISMLRTVKTMYVLHYKSSGLKTIRYLHICNHFINCRGKDLMYCMII